VKSVQVKKKRRKELKRVLKSHPEFELTFDMQLGIRHVLGMNNGGKDFNDIPPSASDFDERFKLDFPKKGSQKPPYTPAHHSRDFKFKTYAPKVFKKIRERFGINNINFITSVCGNFEYLSFMTNSKSGQFFFYSHDQRYMLKTMSPKECELLMKILPAYYEHVMANPNTLLCRFYGMHRVKPAWRKEFHFLIMESIFSDKHREPQLKFDLKGSRIGRLAKRGESVYKVFPPELRSFICFNILILSTQTNTQLGQRLRRKWFRVSVQRVNIKDTAGRDSKRR
jgi:1-phosphatidylinositol-4-phosphate 5-kinase